MEKSHSATSSNNLTHTKTTTSQLTTNQWETFQNQGYLVLKSLLSPKTVESLQERINDIMLGKASVDYNKMLMQLDSETGQHKDLGAQTKGHKGATLNYRKIQDLEYDPLFLETMRHPVFADLCKRTHGENKAIASFRAMFMNKPANRGTYLPWHQDRWTYLDKDPELTVWIALDPATQENGCVQIMPKTHTAGVINPNHSSGFLNDELTSEWINRDEVLYLELEPGDIAILHNKLLHSSDINQSSQSRRAFSICYMEADTIDANGQTYPVIFGDGALNLG